MALNSDCKVRVIRLARQYQEVGILTELAIIFQHPQIGIVPFRRQGTILKGGLYGAARLVGMRAGHKAAIF